MKKIDYEKDLNPAQREAVFSAEGPTLVIAGAGSGKTRTLVYRVAYLVEQCVPPERILLLTFTRKAAQEILSRVETMLDRSCREVAGGTFHSLAYRILRQYGGAIGLKSPLTVIDRKDSEELAAKIIKARKWEKGTEVPDKKEFLDLLSRLSNRGRTFEEGLEGLPHWEGKSPEPWKILYREYERVKQERGLLDYDDLLSLCLRLFRQEPEIVKRLSSYYQYILVDEYQDTNLLQAEMVRYLAGGNIMVVGDDSQSIYAFRGAHFKNILHFPRLFPGTRVIKLEENFRSTQPILDLANRLISHSREKYSKCLYSRFRGGERPWLVELPFEESQSRFVLQTIREYYSAGLPLRDMAVLFRAGHHSFNLEVFLQKENIPFRKYGGRRFVEGAHIKDLLSFLRAAYNPRDVLAWERLLMLHDGLGPKRAEEIIQRMHHCPDWETRLASLTDYPRMKDRLQPLAALFQGLTDLSAVTPAQALELIWGYYQDLLPRLHDEPQRRQKEIEEILRLSYNYSDVESLLADLSLELQDRPEGEEAKGDHLTLSTVHSAKGLEWRVVFVIWLAEGRFPSSQSLADQEETEEERRLLYVAVTRAKERLFLTYPRSLSYRDGGWQKNDLCRFLLPIPEELLPRKSWPVSEIPVKQAEAVVSGYTQEGDDGFSKGTRVFHPIFGNGVIEEAPRERKVRVFFKRYGSKVLHLDYARLQKG